MVWNLKGEIDRVIKLKWNATETVWELTMIVYNSILNRPWVAAALLTAAGLILSGPGEAFGHGGKTHAAEPFSAFQAVQKATQLYDRLIVSEKLSEDWETGLASIHVTVRGTESRREYVVQFKRSGDDPGSVYFYFNRQGDYSGSNFTGK
ncbi:hypothetical protein DSCA_34420 [Desulfosarcina alkanivorans]|uniref:Uncharacterized protein n=1 Tax=Desulfosarcina alkanivorans TaxID=571177 RepID=A0A5K7YIL5_9BACT|nr:hypothetical protein DSCA_34420 [Desulfosarcina alkanivorans]